MNATAKNAGGRLRLKISLDSWEPAIWRRVEVDKALTFGEFHRIIQVAMGWDDDHLHEFRAAGREPSSWILRRRRAVALIAGARLLLEGVLMVAVPWSIPRRTG